MRSEFSTTKTLASDATSRRVVVFFLLLLVIFGVGNGISEWRSERATSEARAIVQDTIPSILALGTTMRTARRLEETTNAFIGAAPPERAVLRETQVRLRSELLRTLVGYRPLTNSPGEHEGDLALEERAERVATASTRACQAADAGDTAGAYRIASDEMAVAVNETAAGVNHLVRINLHEASEHATQVLEARRRALRAAIVMDVAASCIAVLACWIILAAERRDRRFRVRYATVLQERASELEHFAERVAHDIRSPLSTAQLSLDFVARRTDPSSDTRGALERGGRAVQHVNEIVGALLDFAKSGAKTNSEARANVHEVITSSVEDIREEALAANIVVSIRDSAERPEALCDPGLLRSIVVNLVQNAIKYMGDSAEREVTVTTASRGDRLVLEVRDTGPGIPTALQDAIFDLHFRAPRSGASGLGLGLATVKRAALAHGGRVGVRSDVGRGSCFWVELPAAPLATRPLASDSAVVRPA